MTISPGSRDDVPRPAPSPASAGESGPAPRGGARGLRVVCCPDSFKGTATAPEAAEALAAGVRDAGAAAVEAPMADGGEGTAAILAAGPARRVRTVDALGRPAEAEWFPGREPASAVLDVASASGLPAVSDVLDAAGASTYGTGLVLRDVLDHGIRHVILCLGGSATTDGGRGILAAFGAVPGGDARVGDAAPSGCVPGSPASGPAPGSPASGPAREPDASALDPRLRGMRWTLLVDVRTSPQDCASVFGPQKGADGECVAQLTGHLREWCRVCGVDPSTAGYGAAGATPVGLDWLVRAVGGHLELRPGAEHVAIATGLPGLFDDADLVITGEGSVDAQSSVGKVVGHVLDLAEACHGGDGVPVALAAGKLDGEADVVTRSADATALDGPMERTREALRVVGAELVRRAAARRAAAGERA